MSNNVSLNFTGLTRNDIRAQVEAKFASDPIFMNLRDSSVAKLLMDVFIDASDLITYYMERRAEECYLDTAKLRSSVILLARQMGYIVNRPVPAAASISIILKDTSTLLAGDKLSIPARSVFTYEGQKYVLINSYVKTLTQSDIDSKEIAVDLNNDSIVIAQGTIKEKVITGSTNPQVGQPFQTYRIDDITFSNFYGSSDLINPLTRIKIGANKNASVDFDIDRRSIVNWQSLRSYSDENNAICLVRTALDDSVDIMFGDDNFSRIGARYPTDNIFIEYFSTEGSAGNKIGIIGQELNFSGKVFEVNSNNDVTTQLQFYFNSNALGGADIESTDSIKTNSPQIYYSLERLVTKQDYAAFLRSLTTPVDIRNAIVWGENEEVSNRNVEAIKALFNIVFFSCVGSLYNLDGDTYTPKTSDNGLYQAVIDLDFDEYSFAANSYFSIYYNSEVPTGTTQIVGTIKQWEDANVVPPYKVIRSGGDITYGVYVSDFMTALSGVTSIDVDVVYTSINNSTKPNVTGTTSATIEFSSFDDVFNNEKDFCDSFASGIQTALNSISDTRIDPNLPALAYTTVSSTFTSADSGNRVKFELSGSPNDRCVLVSITDKTGNFDFTEYVTTFGNYVYPTSGGNLSKGIVDLVNTLNERSQVTVKNIYVSPIIQGFDIDGDVYINNFFDKNEVGRQINNAIYTWADTVTDFNTNIHRSDIYNIINGVGGVISSNIKFSPSMPSLDTGLTKYWNMIDSNGKYDERLPSSDVSGQFTITSGSSLIQITYNCSALNKAVAEAIDGIIKSELTNLSSYTIENTTRDVYDYKQLYSTSAVISNGCTERYFYDVIVNKIIQRVYYIISAFNSLNNLEQDFDYYSYIRSSNFRGIISDIHKDFMWIIKTNMINTNGDIAKDPDTTKLIGGFSMGVEIVKLTSNLNFKYVS